MEIEPGAVAAGIARHTTAIAPPLLAPVRPVDAADTRATDATSAPRPDVELIITLPDAETVATMQLTSRIPRPQE